MIKEMWTGVPGSKQLVLRITGPVAVLVVLSLLPARLLTAASNQKARRPDRHRIEKAWNIWEAAFISLEKGFGDLEKDFPGEVDSLRALYPDFGEVLMRLRRGGPASSMPELIEAAARFDRGDTAPAKRMAGILRKTANEYSARFDALINTKRIPEGLGAGAGMAGMVALWFRHAYSNPYDVENTIALFGRKLRAKILLRNPISGIGDNTKILHTLFKIYYHMGLKRGLSMEETGRFVADSYCRYMKETGPTERVFTQDTPQGRNRLVWRVEDGAWRLCVFSAGR